MIKTTLIISFYKRTDYLELILAGIRSQNFKDFEIIIADDGSNSEDIKKLTSIIAGFPFPVIHLWHKDLGFRKNRILNRAILTASSDYLIFIDGDCIPHPNFVGEHYLNRCKGVCFTGRRVNLSEKITGSLTPRLVSTGYIQKKFYKLIWDGITGNSDCVEKGFYFKNDFLRKKINSKYRGIVGCNFSVFKSDLLEINGFDTRYEAPSIGEDTDIEYRLKLKGVEIKSLNNIAVQYHLFHKLQERKQVNVDLFNEVKVEGQFFTRFGIKKVTP
ncbi:MAG: glycosyltransferase [Ignavibacteriaceae bacterium]|nr:glycosyltransferase [Ignavibacteriaceae bacterium]